MASTKKKYRNDKENWSAFNYKTEEVMKLDPVRRVCVYLVWGAKVYPGRPCPLRHMVRVWLAQDNLPREGNENIALFKKSALSRIRFLAPREYGCILLPEPGLGYRFSVDSNDIRENYLPRCGQSAVSVTKRIELVVGLINRSELTEYNKREYDRFLVGFKKLNSGSVQNSFKLPADTEKKSDEKKS